MIFSIVLLSAAAVPQGRSDYFNVETPQCHPIEVARIDGYDLLLVCNTPDNSVEVWDTNESISDNQRFIARIPVGLEPCSVRYYAPLGSLFTTNFLGDSVSKVQISLSNMSDPTSFVAELDYTTWVGDEPMDVGFLPVGNDHVMYMSSRTQNALIWFNAESGVPVLPSDYTLELWDNLSNPTEVIKAPHTVLVRNERIYVLGLQGGGFPLSGAFPFDNDIWIGDSTGIPQGTVEGLGTNNLNMNFDANGNLFVVGQEGQNDHDVLADMLAAEVTGFVQSTFYWVQDIDGSPQVHRLNLNATDATENTAVAFADALAQPTDVVPYEPGGQLSKLFFTAMGSDRVGVLEPDLVTTPVNMYNWPIRRIPIAPQSGFLMAGPRGLAVKYANGGQANDPGDRIYCLNRLDHSVTIIDPTNSPETVIHSFSLKNDPQPGEIHNGRRFLYDARLSGNGFVSCASCHVDARLDQSIWNLGDDKPLSEWEPFPAELTDGLGLDQEKENIELYWTFGFPANKGRMVTQSLQGLVNFHVNDGAQDWFTNAPYHWRGDREDFEAFLEAFEVTGLLEGGKVTEAEMGLFREFINTIHYPPNPNQPLDRVYSGRLGKADDADKGLGALAGMKIFHIQDLGECTGRSCVQCHTLPEGSNNLITEVTPAGGGFGIGQPIETAALRGIFQKDTRDDRDANGVSPITSGNFGLLHLGLFLSVNDFIETTFVSLGTNPTDFKQVRVKEFIREYDWHVAPLVGVPYTVTLDNKDNNSVTDFALDLFESQAIEANVGLVVHGWLSTGQQGWWFNMVNSAKKYVDASSSTMAGIDLATLKSLIQTSEDRLVFMCTPLGSDRRIASTSGNSSLLFAAASPNNITLEGLGPNSAYKRVPDLDKNWDPFHADPTKQFNWAGATPTVPFLKAVRLFQRAILNAQSQTGEDWGLDRLRHEAPRRLRVAGNNFVPGALLRVYVPNQPGTPPLPGGPLNQILTKKIEVPIFPTKKRTMDGRQIWASTAELAPITAYLLMNGGEQAPGVSTALFDYFDTIDELVWSGLDPANWNYHFVEVKNPDGMVGAAPTWQRMFMD